MGTESEAYEKNQNFNSITRYLHSFRHQILKGYIDSLSSQITDRPLRLLEIGCNTGKSFGILNESHNVEYVGYDLNQDYIATATERYKDNKNAKFVVADAADPNLYTQGSADLVFALETLEHIPEQHVVRIVENVCNITRPQLFIASVPVEIGPAIWIKTLGSKLMGYKRTPYTLSQAFSAGLYRLNNLPPHGITHRGFNWYWLEQTIRHNSYIRETRSLPWRWLPKPITPTVMFVAEPQVVIDDL